MNSKLQTVQILLLVVLIGCAPAKKDESANLRLISTAPSITEILFALNLEKEIVGVSSLCNYPKEAQNKTEIGTFSYPNIEKIIALKPDIVFLTGLEQSPTQDKLKKLGIKTVTIYPKDIDELYQSIRYIGELTDSIDNAHILINKMKKGIDNIKEKVSHIPMGLRKKILIEMMDDPLIVASKDSFVGELGTIAGGRNIAYDTDRPYPKFSPELVLERNPDSIIMGYMFKDKDAIKRVSQRLGWSNINAVKNKAIFNDINPDILLRPGPRAQEAIEELYKRLYGD